METYPSGHSSPKMHSKTSLVKKLCYWLFVLVLDFSSIYFLTHALDLAFVLMTLHAIYISTGRILFDRIWNLSKS